jgi:cytochrome c peroxidase
MRTFFVCLVVFLGLGACMQLPSQGDHKLVELGRHLFFDTRLSANGTKSCASCHDPKLAFTDGFRLSLGINGDSTQHNAPTLMNSTYFGAHAWSNSATRTFEQQMRGPLFKKPPPEMGLDSTNVTILLAMSADEVYQKLLKSVKKETLTYALVIDAITAYEASFISFESPFDKYVLGDEKALSAEAKFGRDLFTSGRFACGSCHIPPLFTDAELVGDTSYHNIGLYNVGNRNVYPSHDRGLYEHTKKASDDGRFKTPTLRNVAITGPYMHDGSLPTLEAVLEHYNGGGRMVASGPMAGDGRMHAFKDDRIGGINMQPDEKAAVIAFLETLTDTTYLKDPMYQNPWVN